MILVGGGARSGKSAFASRYALRLGARRTYLATAEALDAEMAVRITRHRAERAGSFTTLEEPLALAAALERVPRGEVVLVDCLTLWLSNLLGQGAGDDEILAQVSSVLSVAALRAGPTLLVTNEVGLGLVPESALGRRFRDVAGLVHQRVAAQADEVYLAALGMVIRLCPGPLLAFRTGEVPRPEGEGEGGGDSPG